MSLKQAFSQTDGVTDRLYVATNLQIPIQEDFVPIMAGLPPEQPPSLESQFGLESENTQDVIGLFERWYDQVNNVWTDGNDVNLELKGEVAAAYEAILIYQEAKQAYDDEYNLQKQIQWKIKCADALETAIGDTFVSRVLYITSSSTPAVNTDNYANVSITALAVDVSSVALIGTPKDFQKIIFRIVDNGVSRNITWGSGFAPAGIDLPITTVPHKILTVGFIYNISTLKFGCVFSVQEA